METYNNLEIKGTKSDLLAIVETVRSTLPANWSNDEATAKGYAKTSGKLEKEILCLKSPEVQGNIGIVWFGIWEKGLEVFNIVPKESGSLSYAEYNSILDAFYEECLKVHLVNYKVELQYDTTGIDFEKLAGKATFEKLITWENLCNPSTGNTHPMDFKRWTDFVITAHKTNSELNSTLLTRWLVEERGWNEEFSSTNRIALDYEYAIHILREYDKH